MEGRKGKVFCLFVCLLSTFPCSWSFHFSCTNVQNKEECRAPEPLVPGSTAGLDDTCNVTSDRLWNEKRCCVLFYTDYLLCAMFTESELCRPYLSSQYWPRRMVSHVDPGLPRECSALRLSCFCDLLCMTGNMSHHSL